MFSHHDLLKIWETDNGPDHIYEYERVQHCQTDNYQQIPTDRRKSAVEKFQAHAADVVNILLLCYGIKDGDLVLGDKWLKAKDLVSRLSSFRDAVQVNLFSSSCYSGILANLVAKSNQLNRYVAVAAGPTKISYAMQPSNNGRWQSGRWANAFVAGTSGIVNQGTARYDHRSEDLTSSLNILT